MKKILTIFTTALFILSMMILPTALSAATMDVSINVLGNASDGLDDGGLFGNFFLVDDNIGQDLYLHVQERVRSQGSNLAISRTAARRSLSQAEIYAIVPGSNIGDILSKPSPRAALSPVEISQRRQEIINDLASEKDLADLETKLDMEVRSTELFTNGNEYDSGFDLVTDLDVLQFFLFNKEPPEQMPGGNGGDGNGGGNGVRDQNADPEVDPSQSANNDNNSDNRNRGNGDDPATNPAIAAEADKRVATVECPDNTGLNRAIDDARKDEQAQAQQSRANGGAPAPGDVTGDTVQNAQNAADQKLVPAEPGDWKRKQKCTPTDVFCVIVEYKYKTESAYTASNNCVACHVQKINDSFKKTLSHNLVPNKVTGNLLEGPKCKDALMGANWLTSNIILIGQPILTPPNDDLVIKGNLFRNLLDATERYKPIGICGLLSDCNFDPATQILAQSLPNATFDDTTKSISSEIMQLKDQKVREFNQQQIQARAALEGDQYQVIMSELTAMNEYFANFMQLFTSLVDNPQTSPCGVLANKDTCS